MKISITSKRITSKIDRLELELSRLKNSISNKYKKTTIKSDYNKCSSLLSNILDDLKCKYGE